MKKAKLLIRFILALAFTMLNLFANYYLCRYLKAGLPVWISSEVLSTLLMILVFIYFVGQILLVPYLNYKALESGCKKYGIKYS